MNEQVIDKLKKILRLADNDAATQGEVEAAMARAKEIAMQHNIDLSSIDFSNPAEKANRIEVQKEKVGLHTSRREPYHRLIVWVIKDVFGVTVLEFRGGYTFIGDKNDVAVAKEMWPWLQDTYRRMFYAQVKAGKLYKCAAHYNGFWEGLTWGILEKNKRTVEETLKTQNVDSGKYAMVLRRKDDAISEFMAIEYPKLKNSRSGRKATSAAASTLGYQEGKNLNLHQVGSGGGSTAATLR